ncbi:MAG TPA: succinylglutamate desuccinylase [Cyanobacteria bacterium UBA11149]|nr:succinylglutamate desuccinylase [Cyanobacteria bacterium UBA11367]HBE60427.1 succinylglutamate desuccinylase [Cyanobacteria bacterium UBA11366]HBK64369.1 succinylglutamate desuccinylase [Cyanobacteria bacterium UBA11166]HBR73974.1 succinylglutamate desuccinylase [Cyanobacteria bacterium UBA11159]HBS70109.1 succinylglutamate desuccinylase [Cyanobacteria bacterium UBA11153]HBW88615.1 succinylglutamate desuccinylase [Cyanobacteria bacterium UBA11149]HCA97117.1 succinylglutamate desuccinylase 
MIPAIYTIPIQHLASGDRNFLQVYQFRGAQPGKKAYLQANLHGAEIVGNAVIYQLIEFLRSLDDTQLAGEVWLVPVCNPMGTNQRSHFFATGRYNPYDGRDWNRIFWDYEKEGEDLATFAQSQINLQPEQIRHNYLARIQSSFQQQLGKINSLRAVPFREYYRYQLQSLCLDANYVIDIHSSSNQAIDYLYCFHSREESAKAFQLPYGILLKEYAGNTFDEAFLKPWLALEKKLAELGKYIRFDLESWTLELGEGMVMNPESITKGVIGIENYLAYHGMLTIPGFPLPETGSFSIDFISKSQIQEYYAPMGGMIQSRVELGSEVQAGQVLYQLLVFHKNGELPTLIDISAETDGVIFNLSTSQSVNQGEYVLSIISN